MRNGPRGFYDKTGTDNQVNREMDEALKNRPPVIIWEKNSRGVMVAVEVHDPHGERSTAAQAERLRASADRLEQEEARKAAAKTTEQARLRLVEMLQEEAVDVSERLRTNRANNTRLLNAARTI